jgi:lipoate-protein ligase A
MDLLKLSLPTIAENLALDEALLEEAETKHHAQGILRLWEASQLAVVLGRSSAVADEVNLPYCEQHEIAVARRCSGGASVVVGPGCLMYSVVLPLDTRPELARIDNAHCFVLQTMLRAIRPRFPNAACARKQKIQWQQSPRQAYASALPWHAAVRLSATANPTMLANGAATAHLSRRSRPP